MSGRSGEPGAASCIRVAIVEQQPERRQHMLAQVGQRPDRDAHLLRDASAYRELYGRGQGPDVLLAGLDDAPQEALAIAGRVLTQAPACRLIVYGGEASVALLPRAMVLGARRYLPYPCDDATLHTTIDEVYAEARPQSSLTPDAAMGRGADVTDVRDPKVVAVYSPKGGVGTTTLAVNLACALTTLGRSVAIVDGNVSFGNVGILLNLRPSRSMLELAASAGPIDETSVDDALVPHDSGIRALLAPPTPEDGDNVTREHLCAIIAALRARHDYVIVDTWSSYDERALSILEASDQILVPTAPELQSIHNLTAFLRVAGLLGYPEEKLIPVLMRADSVEPSYLRELERLLARPFTWRVVSDGKRVTQSVIDGEPFVLTDPNAPVSQNVYALAAMLDTPETADAAAKPGRRGWRHSLFGRARAS